MFTDGMLLRVYLSEAAQIDGEPAYKHLMEFYRKMGFPGCTVYKGIVGYGHEKQVKMFDVYHMAVEVPVVVDIVHEKEKIQEILPQVEALVEHGLVITQPVRMSRKTPP